MAHPMSKTAQTHYDVLGLAHSAPEDVIKAAYRARIKTLHPDRGGDTDEMSAVNDAYAILSDPAKRASYDRDLKQSTNNTPPDDTTGSSPSRDDADVDDDQYWTDAGWWDEEAVPSPHTETPQAAADSPETEVSAGGGGLLSMFSTFCLMGLWTLTLVVAGTVIVGGIINDLSWKEIVLNLVFVAAFAVLTGAMFFRRAGQPPKSFPSKAYLALVAALLVFGISQISSDALMGSAVLVWAGLLVVGAEAGCYDREKSWAT